MAGNSRLAEGLNSIIMAQLSTSESKLINPDDTAIIDLDSLVKEDDRHPYLVIFIGNNNGRRHKLKRGIMTVGRSPQADITIEDDWISRIHCIIEWMGDRLTIQDKGSTNGTYVDTRKVKRAHLAPGLPVQLGHSIMKIEYKSEAEIRSEEKLLHRASFDALTGIFNRQHFNKLATMEMTYASRHKLLVGIILMDIDNFKQVNDTYGHQCGDTILAQFANIIIENKRTEDIFARFGGEEFIILPRGEINREDMQVQCERIRKAVKKFVFRCDEACFQLTVSLGFHIAKASGSDVDSMLKNLIRKADQALYLAKENGRDRIENLL